MGMEHQLLSNPLIGMLLLLAESDDPTLRSSIAIPDTLVVEDDGRIELLYVHDVANGIHLAYEQQWTDDKIVKFFGSSMDDRRTSSLDIRATFTTLTPQLSVEYFTFERLREFLNSIRPPGLLQRYLPTSKHHTMTQIIWTPFVMVAEKRSSMYPISETSIPISDRTDTSKNCETSKELPVSVATQAVLDTLCRKIYLLAHKHLNITITKLSLYLAENRSNPAHTLLFTSLVSAYASVKKKLQKKESYAAYAEEICESLGEVKKREVSYEMKPRDEEDDDIQPGVGYTAPAPSPCESDDENQHFGVEVVPFASKNTSAELMVFVPVNVDLRPDSYLVMPATVPDTLQTQSFSPKYTAAQKRQLTGLATSIRDSFKTEPSKSNNKHKIISYAAAEQILERDVPRNGVHALRRKYLHAAQAAVLQGKTKPVEIDIDDVEKIPQPARVHIVNDTTVVGAATPAKLATRPASAPPSKLLSVLQEIDAADSANAPVATSYEEIALERPSASDMETTARRLVSQKNRSAREKQRLATPSLNAPLPAPIKPVALNDSRAKKISVSDQNRSTLQQEGGAALLGSLKEKELQWDNCNVSEGMLMHMPRTFTQRYAEGRCWLYDLNEVRPVLSESRETRSHRKLSPRPHQADVPTSVSYASLAKAELHRKHVNSDPSTPTPSPGFRSRKYDRVTLCRQPLHDAHDYHQSISEVLRSKYLKRQQTGQKDLLRPLNERSGTTSLLDILFTENACHSSKQPRAEDVPIDVREVRRLSEEKKALEEKALKLEDIKTKRQRMQLMREGAKVRAQYNAMESKYRNETAMEFAEDTLYKAYSKSLESRLMTSKGGGSGSYENAFSFIIPVELRDYFQHVHSLLVGLGFSHSCTQDDEPPTAQNSTYTLSNDKVLLTNIMASLTRYKSHVQYIFDDQDVAVMHRLKQLIDPPRNQQAVPLFNAVGTLNEEFNFPIRV